MLNNKIQDALNAQINAELWSAYLYLSMSMHFQAEGRNGIANWFAIQFKEEQAHAQIFMNYINQRGGRVVLKPIDAVPTEWASPLAAFEHTLQHENKKKTTPHATVWHGSSPSRLKRRTTAARSSTNSSSWATTAWDSTCSIRNWRRAPTPPPRFSQPSDPATIAGP